MDIFPTLSSFMVFILGSISLLTLIYIYDEPIRRFEDRMIAKIRTKLFRAKKTATLKKVEVINKKNMQGERIA